MLLVYLERSKRQHLEVGLGPSLFFAYVVCLLSLGNEFGFRCIYESICHSSLATKSQILVIELMK